MDNRNIGSRSGGGACQDERCQNGGGGTLDCMFHKIHPSIKKSAGYQFLGKLRSGVVCNFLTSKLLSQKSGAVPAKRIVSFLMAINSHLIGITKSIPIFPENCNGFVTNCNILARMVIFLS